jgi:hypothetical protein
MNPVKMRANFPADSRRVFSREKGPFFKEENLRGKIAASTKGLHSGCQKEPRRFMSDNPRHDRSLATQTKEESILPGPVPQIHGRSLGASPRPAAVSPIIS